MGDESASDGEMGNHHGPGKKDKSTASCNLSDADNSDYKYVSIVDVNPPTPSVYDSAVESVEEDPPSGPVLKCSVVIGEEEGQSVSRVSVNGLPNGSSSFLEMPNGHVNGFSTVLSPVQNGSSSFHVPDVSCEESLSSSSHLNRVDRSSPSYLKALEVEVRRIFREALGDSRLPKEDVEDMIQHRLEGLRSGGNDNWCCPGDWWICDDSDKQCVVNDPDLPVGSSLPDQDERVVRQKLKRQRSGSSDCWNLDDSDDHCIVDFLDKISDDAEARLAAKRQARAEAREIRMRELERMQRETEDGDKVYDIYSTPDAVSRAVRAGSVAATPRSLLSSNNSYHSSRRSSEDSLEEANSIRDVRHELKELEEKFRKAMIANAQLDNEKASAAYQVDLFKDKYEELEETNSQLVREHKDTCRQLEQTKRHRNQLQEDLDVTRTQLSELLQLIQEKGLVVVEGDCSSSDEESEGADPRPKKQPKKALVSAEVADVLQQGTGSLDVRLKRFVEERNELMDELRRVKLELEEERARARGRHNGPADDTDDIQREANKLLGDYKFKLQKAEQDVSTLQANVARLESQVVRYKSAAETSEKLEDELKLEKRKLQRELREAQGRVEELETSHSHLQRRLDKLKNAKSNLLKEL